MRTLWFAALLACAASPLAAFEIDFRWPQRDLCFGSPDEVESPEFSLDDVPEGTRFISFELVDLDTGNSLGGGTVEWDGGDEVPRGAFSFAAPCAEERHDYEWTATAQEKRQSGRLDTATATRSYPE